MDNQQIRREELEKKRYIPIGNVIVWKAGLSSVITGNKKLKNGVNLNWEDLLQQHYTNMKSNQDDILDSMDLTGTTKDLKKPLKKGVSPDWDELLKDKQLYKRSNQDDILDSMDLTGTTKDLKKPLKKNEFNEAEFFKTHYSADKERHPRSHKAKLMFWGKNNDYFIKRNK